nr:unnamed protein product [Callosobruchus chinensis]
MDVLLLDFSLEPCREPQLVPSSSLLPPLDWPSPFLEQTLQHLSQTPFFRIFCEHPLVVTVTNLFPTSQHMLCPPRNRYSATECDLVFSGVIAYDVFGVEHLREYFLTGVFCFVGITPASEASSVSDKLSIMFSMAAAASYRIDGASDLSLSEFSITSSDFTGMFSSSLEPLPSEVTGGKKAIIRSLRVNAIFVQCLLKNKPNQ